MTAYLVMTPHGLITTTSALAAAQLAEEHDGTVTKL